MSDKRPKPAIVVRGPSEPGGIADVPKTVIPDPIRGLAQTVGISHGPGDYQPLDVNQNAFNSDRGRLKTGEAPIDQNDNTRLKPQTRGEVKDAIE